MGSSSKRGTNLLGSIILRDDMNFHGYELYDCINAGSFHEAGSEMPSRLVYACHVAGPQTRSSL